MPARQLPAAQAAASCGGRRGSDVHAHHQRSRGRPPAAALFPGGWAALDSQGLPGPTRHPSSFLHCARTRAQRPRPAPHAPALPPAAEALVRLRAGGRSAPVGARPCPAPSRRAPPPVPVHPYPPVDPVPPSALVGSAPPRARESVLSQDLMVRQDKEAWRGVENRQLGTTSCSKVYGDQKFELGLRKDQALCVAALGDIWPEFAFQ